MYMINDFVLFTEETKLFDTMAVSHFFFILYEDDKNHAELPSYKFNAKHLLKPKRKKNRCSKFSSLRSLKDNSSRCAKRICITVHVL